MPANGQKNLILEVEKLTLRVMLKTVMIFVVSLSLYQSLQGQDAASWRRFSEGSKQVFCQPKDAVYGQQLLSWTQQWLKDFHRHHGAPPDSVTLIVAPHRQAFQRMTGGRVPDWGAAAALPEQGVVIVFGLEPWTSKERARQVLGHELGHLILAHWCQGPVPRWFDEGVAQLWAEPWRMESAVRLARARRSHQLPALSDLDDLLSLPRAQANVAYTAAYDAVRYLTVQHGVDVIRRLGWQLTAGQPFPAAFKGVTGESPARFESKWLAGLAARYRWAWLLEWPMLFSLSLVVLLILAFVAVRRRHRLRLSQMQELEAYSYEMEEN